MQRFLQWMRGSIIRKVSIAFAVVSVFVLAVTLPAVILTELSLGSGGAINVSGSLRMQSYKLALAVASPYQTTVDRIGNTIVAVDEFGDKLVSKGLLSGIVEGDPAHSLYIKLKNDFETEIRPLALRSIHEQTARREFVEKVPDFVIEVDHFVQVLEDGLNRRMAYLRWLLISMVLGLPLACWLIIRAMKRDIFQPLNEVVRVSNAVRRGEMDERVKVPVSENEIGKLSGTFNFMLEELSKLYADLEGEVARKTEDLNRRNEGLQLLSQVAPSLKNEGRIDAQCLGPVLDTACGLLGAQSIAVYTGQQDYCLAASTGAKAGTEEHAVPLSHQNPALGRMVFCFEHPVTEGWVSDYMVTLAETVGRRVEAITRQLDDRRLAVLEERSTIARELHDSIAQSLSYSRMQMHRLKVFIERGEPHEKVLEAVSEVSQGISTAYSQLREVLTAFRLQITGSGLNAAVEEICEEFRNRAGLPVSIENNLAGLELTPNGQVHLVHILREALVNTEKHARATQASVRFDRTADGEICMTVTDNGIGISDNPGRQSHFGLQIMCERAQALGGTLTFERISVEGGTRVTLKFPETPPNPAVSG